jgi:hypothetical protein
LMTEEIRSSETLAVTRVTWHNIPEDGILHSISHENIKSYMMIVVFLGVTLYVIL